MKAGLITSAALHVAVLGFALVTFSSPMPFEAVQTEALPVSLVPLSDDMVVKQGDMSAAKAEKPAPKPTRKPQEKPDAKNVGDGKVDTKMPFKPKEKPREIEVAPPPAGVPDAKADMAPFDSPKEKELDEGKARATEIKSKSEPPQTRAVENPDKTAEAKPAETALPPKMSEPEAAPSLPDKGPVPDNRPQQVARTAERKPQTEARASASSAKGDAVEDILARADNALVDKTRTQGGGARRSEDPAAFGGAKNINENAAFQQTLNNIIGSCVQRNWNLAAITGSTAYDLRVIVHFRLRQDGALDGEPDMAPAGGDAAQREIIAIQAREALKKCAPFALPADKYNQWHDVTVNMKAFPD